jgi:hypothetical protein
MSDRIAEIVAIAPMSTVHYMLFVDYEEGDAGNGVGHVQRTDGARQTTLEPVLSTNDTLRALWGSPSGAVWTSSEDGNVWTTAGVKWSKARQDDLDSQSFDPSLRWTVTTLPNLRDKGYAPTLGALWGTSDSDVFVAAAGGHIYQWNGKVWSQTYSAAGGIRGFAGTGPRNVYAVGENATLLHFDGNAWGPMQSPAEAVPGETFTGCCIGPDAALLVCSLQGRLLHGSAGGLNVLGRADELQFRGIATLDNRVVLTAGPAGVVEFAEQAFVPLRSTFHALSVTPGRGKLFFLDASAEATYVEYDPADSAEPWWRISF